MRGDKKDYMSTHVEQRRFKIVKKRIPLFPTLLLPSFSWFFQVECDTSESFIGVFLNKEGRLIALFSRKLDDPKVKYLVYDK